MRKTKWLALVSVGMLACGGDEGGAKLDEGDDPSQLGDAASPTPSGDASSSDAGLGDGGRKPTGNTCATVTTGVDLQPVHLAFAFDVSGSMGNGDRAWYDKALKWDPVVAATKSFFASESAKGMSASLTFFPGPNSRLICSNSEYAKPDVAFTALPSQAFATAIDAVAPKTKAEWRSGTPTLAVLQGTGQFVVSARDREAGRYAMVLVTDGYPQSCGNTADKVDTVVAEAKAQLAKDLPTYVIGVANPAGKGGPDTVTDLHRIAAAGGTDQAVLIDTGNPDATVTAFSAAIERIRQATISCSLAIPSENQAGRAFDKQSVVVHYDGSQGSTELKYDAECKGSNGWHYDDVNNPTEIELCDQTCTTVRADANAKLAVEFSCERVILI
ncbi:MAG: vWA domain-containing protein [Polyangiales bacterium]